MVEDKWLIGELGHQPGCHRQLMRKHEQIVGKPKLAQLADASLELGPEHELIVGLILQDMADSDQLRVGTELVKLAMEFR